MSPQTTTGQGGAVAAGDARTVAAAIDILRAGGNAVDAALAATLAAFLTEPVLTGPYGGGFGVVATPHGDHALYDFFATMPGLDLGPAEHQEGLDFHGVDVQFGPATQRFYVGRGAAAGSAMVPGLLQLHHDFGRLPLEQLSGPAVAYCQDGVTLSPQIASMMATLAPILKLSSEVAALFAPRGKLLSSGDRFANPTLGQFLTGFADGLSPPIQTELLDRFGPPHGRLGIRDLVSHDIRRSPPLALRIADHDLLLNGPPAVGGLLIAFGLKLLEGIPRSVWTDDTQTMLCLLACMSVTQRARVEILDPAANSASVTAIDGAGERLLSKAVLERYQVLFESARQGGLIPHAQPTPTIGSTTHVSVLDSSGMACAITSSNGEGCGHLVPGLGAMANNFLGEEDLHPNGFHTRAPGTRLTSMMSPTVVLEGGRPCLALGTGGSNRIRTAILQVLAHHFWRGLPIHDAVMAPRLHYEGDVLYVEARGPDRLLASAALEALVSRVPSAVVFDTPNLFFGGVHVAAPGRGVGDPRRGGEAGVS